MKRYTLPVYFAILKCFVQDAVGEVTTLLVPSAGNCGDRTLLTCRVTDGVSEHRLWRKGLDNIMLNGQEITVSGKYVETILIDGFQLEIHNTSLADADSYFCYNGFERSEVQTLEFECKARSATVSAIPDGCLTVAIDRLYPSDAKIDVTVTSESSGQTEQLTGVTKTSSSKSETNFYKIIWNSVNALPDGHFHYNISVTTITTADPILGDILILGPKNMRFEPAHEEYTKHIASSLSVKCLADCVPLCTFEWVKDASIRVSQHPILSLSNIQQDDSGTYTCKATRGPFMIDHSLILNVEGFPDIQIAVKDNQTTTNVGNTVEIICVAKGTPRSMKFVKWIHLATDKTTRIQKYASQKTTEDSCVLQLTAVTYMDSGLYVCGANNGISEPSTGAVGAKAEIFLWVKDRPVILDHIKIVAGDLMSNVTLSVLFFSNDNKAPDVIWSKIKNGIKMKIDKTVNKYEFSVSRLQVETKYYNVKMTQQGYRADLAILNINEADLITYEANVINSIGSVVAQTVLRRPGIPEAPTEFTVIGAAETELRLSWLPGFHGGDNQTFILEYKTYNSDWSKNLIEGDLTQEVMNATISHLEPATNYTLRISARNSLGMSDGKISILTVRTLENTCICNYLDLCSEQDAVTDKTNHGAVAGGTAGGFILGLICAVIVVFIIKFHRNKLEHLCRKETKTKDMELKKSGRHLKGDNTDDKYYNLDIEKKEGQAISSAYEDLDTTAQVKQRGETYDVLTL